MPTLVVPGNHDVPLYRFWERLAQPLGAYRKHFSPDLEPTLELGDELLIIGVNTAHGLTLKDGRISLPRLKELAKVLSSVPPETFKVVVAHHQLIPPPAFGSQRVLRRAKEAVEVFSSAGVDLILSGHMHQTYIGSSEEFYPRGESPVLIVHSGTTTSSRGRGVERKKNSCNWIVLEEESISVSHWLWHPEPQRFAEQSRHHYPRSSRVPYILEGLNR